MARLSYVDVLKQRHTWIEQLGNEAFSNDDMSRWLTRSLAYESGSSNDEAQYACFPRDQDLFNEAGYSIPTERNKLVCYEDEYGAKDVTCGEANELANFFTPRLDANDCLVLPDHRESTYTRKRQASSPLQSIAGDGLGETGPGPEYVVTTSPNKRARNSPEAPRPASVFRFCKETGRGMIQCIFQKLAGN